MNLSDLKKLINECILEQLSEVEPDSPTGMFAVNLESGDQSEEGQLEYYTIAFVNDYQDPEPLKLIKMKGPDAAIDYLSQWDQGRESEVNPSPTPPWGSSDKTFDRGDYILSWNEPMGYVALTRTSQSSSSGEVSEMTTTGAVAGYQTPFAFSKRGDGSKRAVSATKGYTKVKKTGSKNKEE